MASGVLFPAGLFSLLFALALGTGSLRGSVADREDAMDVYSMAKMTDLFVAFMSKKQASFESFGTSEQARLEMAILSAPRPEDKSLLENTARVTEENRLEAQNALRETSNFLATLKQIMGAVGSASTCAELTCGDHAYCKVESLGARCLCNSGFEGNGFVCKIPLQLKMTALVQTQQPGHARSHMADLRVTTLQGDVVVAVYRDMSNANKGYVMLGRAARDGMQWHTPVLFSNQSQAFSPVLVQLIDDAHGTGKGNIAIAFRDADRGGDGLLLSGKVDSASGKVTFGSPKAFARHQAQAMAMVPLPDSHVAVIFAEHQFQGVSGQVLGGAMYGAALLAQVGADDTQPTILSKDRFATGPVARFSIASLSPSSFGIAYRQGSIEDGSSMAEAACIVGEFHKSHIMFNSVAMLLEPGQSHIWARSLSVVGKNTMAYTYHSGDEKVTKQAILLADPKTHRLNVVHGPVVLAEGFSPVIGSLAVVPQEFEVQSSLLLTSLGHDGPKPAEARLCRVTQGVPSGCVQISWAARNLATVSATPVSDGRFVILTTDASGNPYYQIAGMIL